MTATEPRTCNIAEGLEPLIVPIERLSPLPGNARRGDVPAIARSLARFAQRKPVVATADGVVTAGNHMLAGALELGWTHLAAVFVPDDEMTAHAFALADNRTADLGTYDEAALAVLIGQVHDADIELLGATGYSGDDLQALLNRLEEAQSDADQGKGALLAQADVTVGEPSHRPTVGSRWRLGRHTLVVADLMRQHDKWRDLLVDGAIFCPYPGPFVATATGLGERVLVMVQPDTFLAGHLLDKYAALYGHAEIEELA